MPGDKIPLNPLRKTVPDIVSPYPGHKNTPLGTFAELPPGIRSFFPDGHNMVRVGVDDDGSCFYHTLVAGLNINNWHSMILKERYHHGLNLRKKIAEYLSETTWRKYWAGKGVSAKAVPSVEKMKKDLNNYRTWADVYAIMYVAHVLGLNVLVFDFVSEQIYCGTHNEDNTNNTLFIAWIEHSHFEPILEITKENNVFGSFDKKSPVLGFVMNKYKEQGCPAVSLQQILLRARRARRARR